MARFAAVRASGGPISSVGAVASGTVASIDLAGVAFSGAPDNVGCYAEAVLVGKCTATTGAPVVNDVVVIKVARGFKRIAGVVTALGAGVTAIVPATGDASLLAATGLLNVTGTSVRVQGGGVATGTIEWTAHLSIYTGEFTG